MQFLQYMHITQQQFRDYAKIKTRTHVCLLGETPFCLGLIML